MALKDSVIFTRSNVEGFQINHKGPNLKKMVRRMNFVKIDGSFYSFALNTMTIRPKSWNARVTEIATVGSQLSIGMFTFEVYTIVQTNAQAEKVFQ